VTGGAFWQIHPGAADVLAEAVVAALHPRPEETALDLYAGAGLFAGVLGLRLAGVLAVEGDRTAAADARHNLADLPGVEVRHAPVTADLLGRLRRRPDLVVLDPPRTGAGREVTEALARLGPRAVTYVACDPAALARDVATFGRHGYRLAALRAFDLFPMTAHVECVALLEPG
jgi:tRNA/tmRNA/rRNA uracil-C5-methylase (TrmA/RlmC/RlmD family)